MLLIYEKTFVNHIISLHTFKLYIFHSMRLTFTLKTIILLTLSSLVSLATINVSPSQSQDACVITKEGNTVCGKPVKLQKQVAIASIQPQKKIVNGVMVVATACARDNDNIVCPFSFNNTKSTRLVVFGAGELVDNNGIAYSAKSILIANKQSNDAYSGIDASTGVVYSGMFVFENVPQPINKLQLFKFKVDYHNNSEFRNLSIVNG